jgi:DNA-binding NarL/FixJ family response regulator
MRVFIVDDHPLFRRGLKRVLEDNGHKVVGEAGNAEEALRRIRPGLADAVFMDLQMPGLDGIAATRALAGVVPVIALTVSEHDADLARVIDAGASGYLVKRAEPAQILEALQAVSSGQCVLAPELTEKAFSAMKHRAKDEFPSLSKRQRQVLAGIAAGLSLPEMSEQLGISVHTVKTYLERLSEKLGTSSRAKLRVLASRQLGNDGQPGKPAQE